MPNWIDTVFLVLLAVIAVKSFLNGTFRSVLEIFLFFTSIYLAEKICHSLIINAELFAASNTLAYAAFFIFFFFVACLVLKIGLWVLSKVIKIEVMGKLDKAIAVGVGVLIALLNAGLLINVAFMFPLSSKAQAYIETSQVYRYAKPVFDVGYEWAFKFAPQMDKLIGKNIEEKIKAKAAGSKKTIINLNLPELKKLNLPKLSINNLNNTNLLNKININKLKKTLE